MIEEVDTAVYQETADVLRRVGVMLASGDKKVSRLIELAALQLENASDVIKALERHIEKIDEIQRGSIEDLYEQIRKIGDRE